MADWSSLCSVVLKFSAKVIDVSRPEYVGLDLNDRKIWLKKYRSSISVERKCKNCTAVTKEDSCKDVSGE